MPNYRLMFFVLNALLLTSNISIGRSLTPPAEPKDDSFYICYEKRFPNNVYTQGPTPRSNSRRPCATFSSGKAIFPDYVTYKYIGCIISRLPCHLYTSDKFHAHALPLKQFQWMNTYPKALNSFYRCAYS